MAKSAIAIVTEFLKNDPNPPTANELMTFFKSVSKEEREAWAKSIDPTFEPSA